MRKLTLDALSYLMYRLAKRVFHPDEFIMDYDALDEIIEEGARRLRLK
jgi:hypothetical protein